MGDNKTSLEYFGFGHIQKQIDTLTRERDEALQRAEKAERNLDIIAAEHDCKKHHYEAKITRLLNWACPDCFDEAIQQIKTAERERDEARAENARLRDGEGITPSESNHKLKTQLHHVVTQRDEAWAALRLAEWRTVEWSDGVYDGECHVCDRTRDHDGGHAADCPVGKALAATEQPT